MRNYFKSNKVRANKRIKGKKYKSRKPIVYTEPSWTVYKITNLFDDRIYVGVTSKSLDIRLKEHKFDAFNNRTNMIFHEFVRSVSDFETFDNIFKIEPIISGITIGAYAIENAVISNYLSKGALMFNTSYTSKYDTMYTDVLDSELKSIDGGLVYVQ